MWNKGLDWQWRSLLQICVVFFSGIHGVWYMGQFGSAIGIWNQYSKIFRNENVWIFFGINIPNFNLVNLGPFSKVLPKCFIKEFPLNLILQAWWLYKSSWVEIRRVCGYGSIRYREWELGLSTYLLVQSMTPW